MAFWVQKMPLYQIGKNGGKIGTVFIANCKNILLQNLMINWTHICAPKGVCT